MHITKISNMWKQPIWKGYIPYDSNDVPLRRRQTMKIVEGSVVAKGYRAEERTGEHRGFLGPWNYSV